MSIVFSEKTRRTRLALRWPFSRQITLSVGTLLVLLAQAVCHDTRRADRLAAVLVLVRWVAKFAAVFALARPSGLAWKQAGALGVDLGGRRDRGGARDADL